MGRTGKGEAENTFPQADTGRSALLSHIGPICGTPTARSGVGRTQQTGCRSGMNETNNRRVFAWLGVWREYFKFTNESAKQLYNNSHHTNRSSERSESTI